VIVDSIANAAQVFGRLTILGHPSPSIVAAIGAMMDGEGIIDSRPVQTTASINQGGAPGLGIFRPKP
jgi:hypothetical protein